MTEQEAASALELMPQVRKMAGQALDAFDDWGCDLLHRLAQEGGELPEGGSTDE